MATKDIGFKVQVVEEEQTKVQPFENKDLDILNENLDISWEEPEQLKVPLQEREPVIIKTVDQKQKIQEEIAKWNEYLTAAEHMQNVLKSRLNDRVVRVPSARDPSVRDAIRRTFGIDSDIITYDMFRKCLELRSELAAEQRKQTYGKGAK